MHNATKNSTFQSGVLYSTQQNVSKTQSKNLGHPVSNHDLFSNLNLFGSVANSRSLSNELQAPNSHSSITNSHEIGSILQTEEDSFFDMLQDYKPAVLGVIGTNQRSPGPSEFMQNKDTQYPTYFSNKDLKGNTKRKTNSNSCSIKVKNKMHGFLIQPKPKFDNTLLDLSILTKNWSNNEDMTEQSSHSVSLSKRTFLSTEEIEDRERKKTFGHYDCQSIAASMNYVKTKGKLSMPNNNISGATVKPLHSISPEFKNSSENANELLESCPDFCSEIGGNDSRLSYQKSNTKAHSSFISRSILRSMSSCSVSILESLLNESLWRDGVCPFQNDSYPIEYVDHGAHYYKRYFFNQKHENWFGIDENLGPIAISIKKERMNDNGNGQHYLFRVIIRNSNLLTLRGLIVGDCIINSRVCGKYVTTKELLEYIAPNIQLNGLRLGVNTSNAEEQLLKLDEQRLQNKYKVGILYCRSGQSSEEDMYNNENAGPAFTEFLEIIGKRVTLKGFQKYKAGLDNKSDSTGTHSVYACYKNCEIMFHVCTMLPFTANNRQQLLRKRHIGNDIVTIIFQEPGALPFDPKNIRSQFQHVFLIVRAVNPCSSNTIYRVAIIRCNDVPVFGPPLPATALFLRNKLFTEFILAKAINAENAAHCSDKFANLAIRTRREYLKELCINYCSNTSIDPVNKFSIFANRKKEKMKIRFSADLFQSGAICWRILLQDHDSDIPTECFVGISIETFIIIEESSKSVIFAIPTRSILGWSTCNYFRIFYHNGECITFNIVYFGPIDEQLQIVERLRAVTFGNGALELNFRRNIIMQLGFHVQPDGIVTQVDATGHAWGAGMRRGYRLVEVSKIVVATLSYAELIDLLKTSTQMNIIVIKSVSDGTPRLGCFNKKCKINLVSQEYVYSSSNKYLQGIDDCHVKSLLRKKTGQHLTLDIKSSGSCEQRSLSNKSIITSRYKTGSSCFSLNSLGHEYKRSENQFNSISPKYDKWYDALNDHKQRKIIRYAHYNQSVLKLFDHSLKSDEPSGLSINYTINLPLQNGTSSLLQRDIRKLSYLSPEYEVNGFKSVNLSQNASYNLDNAIGTYSKFDQTNKTIESRLEFKNENF